MRLTNSSLLSSPTHVTSTSNKLIQLKFIRRKPCFDRKSINDTTKINIKDLERELSEESEEDLSRDEKVLEIVLSKRIYRIDTSIGRVYIYRSGREDYLVIPKRLCTCPDFIINVVSRGKRSSCIHLRAVEYIERKNLSIPLMKDVDWRNILYKIISTGSI
jgi:predicted nucleic acid-binding Zn finger protein